MLKFDPGFWRFVVVFLRICIFIGGVTPPDTGGQQHCPCRPSGRGAAEHRREGARGAGPEPDGAGRTEWIESRWYDLQRVVDVDPHLDILRFVLLVWRSCWLKTKILWPQLV